MWTTDNDHGAQLQFHTGRHVLEGQFPTIGSWVHYGLGSLNENLPQFVVLGTPIADCCGGMGGHGANYLGPEHAGVQLAVDPTNPLPFAAPGADVFREEQPREFDLPAGSTGSPRSSIPTTPRSAPASSRTSWPSACRSPSPRCSASKTSRQHPELYGLDHDVTRPFGEMCLAARRLVERGVRFVQIFHGSNGGAGAWDAHRPPAEPRR